MQKNRSIFAFVLLMVWMVAPALRCLVPDQVLTPEERACCKAMGGQCGESRGSDHPCCKRTMSKAQPALATAPTHVTVPVLIPAQLSQVLVSLPDHDHFVAHWLADPSPPPGLNQFSSILRI